MASPNRPAWLQQQADHLLGPSLSLCCLQELMRRCDTLIRLVEKENEDFDAAEREERKKGGGKKAGAASRATDSSGAAGASKVGGVLHTVWLRSHGCSQPCTPGASECAVTSMLAVSQLLRGHAWAPTGRMLPGCLL